MQKVLYSTPVSLTPGEVFKAGGYILCFSSNIIVCSGYLNAENAIATPPVDSKWRSGNVWLEQPVKALKLSDIMLLKHFLLSYQAMFPPGPWLGCFVG
jgi:hypothetical protein